MSYFKDIRAKGYLMVGYSFIKSLGLVTATVLERLHVEYNYALTNNNFANGYFLTSLKELNYYLNIPTNDIAKAIKTLSDLKLIEYKIANEYYFIYIDKEQVTDFVKTAERKHSFRQWDTCLKPVQSYIYVISDMENDINDE